MSSMPLSRAVISRIEQTQKTMPCPQCGGGDGCDHCNFMGRILNPAWVTAKKDYETQFSPLNLTALLDTIETLEAEAKKNDGLREQIHHWKGEYEKLKSQLIDQEPIKRKLDDLNQMDDAFIVMENAFAEFARLYDDAVTGTHSKKK